jgi:hypothetical protein
MTMNRALMKAAALQLRRAGFPIVLLKQGTKVHAFKNPEPLDDVALNFWLTRRDFNIAIQLGDGLMAVDCDSPDAEKWAAENGLLSRMINETSKGIHILMRTDIAGSRIIRFRGMMVDLLFRGHLVAPPSVNAETQWRYRWRNGICRPDELPLFPGQLLETVESKTRKEVRHVVGQGIYYPTKRNIRDPISYVMAIPSVQGNGGSKGLIKALAVLRDCGVAPTKAWEVINEWNLRAQPPWSEEELRRSYSRIFS